MFSVIFPGQGSQTVGMAKNLYNEFPYVKELFNNADDILKIKLSDIIFNGPKEELNLTINTQPAIFLVSYSIFTIIKKETKFNLEKANFFAGHSLGEYSALAASDSIVFEDAIKLLKIRAESMQSAVPKGEGGMIAVLGSTPEFIEKIVIENKDNYECYIANDNTNGQLVISGKLNSLDKLILDLNKNNIKSIKLPVSAPFHCKLMNNATKVMQSEIQKYDFKNPKNTLISNVTSEEVKEASLLKDLLVKQIESSVRWRDNVNLMLQKK